MTLKNAFATAFVVTLLATVSLKAEEPKVMTIHSHEMMKPGHTVESHKQMPYMTPAEVNRMKAAQMHHMQPAHKDTAVPHRMMGHNNTVNLNNKKNIKTNAQGIESPYSKSINRNPHAQNQKKNTSVMRGRTTPPQQTVHAKLHNVIHSANIAAITKSAHMNVSSLSSQDKQWVNNFLDYWSAAEGPLNDQSDLGSPDEVAKTVLSHINTYCSANSSKCSDYPAFCSRNPNTCPVPTLYAGLSIPFDRTDFLTYYKKGIFDLDGSSGGFIYGIASPNDGSICAWNCTGAVLSSNTCFS